MKSDVLLQVQHLSSIKIRTHNFGKSSEIECLYSNITGKRRCQLGLLHFIYSLDALRTI
eukprot:c12508_g1_i1 orf=237-413(+)